MPFADHAHPFTQKNVDNGAAEAAVYLLSDDYVGQAQGGRVTIRSRPLPDQYAEREGPCTQGATSYARETTTRSAAREKELLEEYERRYKRLPRCNLRVGY